MNAKFPTHSQRIEKAKRGSQALLRRVRPTEPDSAILRADVNQRTAAAQVEVEIPGSHIPRHSDREVRLNPALSGFRLHMRRVVRRHGDRDAAVAGANFHLTAVPNVSGQLDL